MSPACPPLCPARARGREFVPERLSVIHSRRRRRFGCPQKGFDGETPTGVALNKPVEPEVGACMPLFSVGISFPIAISMAAQAARCNISALASFDPRSAPSLSPPPPERARQHRHRRSWHLGKLSAAAVAAVWDGRADASGTPEDKHFASCAARRCFHFDWAANKVYRWRPCHAE